MPQKDFAFYAANAIRMIGNVAIIFLAFIFLLLLWAPNY